MMDIFEHKYLVPFDESFKVAGAQTEPPEGEAGKKKNKPRRQELVEELSDLQEVLYAHDKYAVLLIFQAMDAAGKDGTIRRVFSGVNPAGFQVFSFKSPSAEELDHDYLWRTSRRLPERGRIGVFNRSYYEEVLVVRVHPEYLGGQKLPGDVGGQDFWEGRFQSIREHEAHLARNGVLVLKFWLNVSKDEQRDRFLARLNEPEKNWKFSVKDVEERGHWERYMGAYEELLNATSRGYAPWYAIPADDKPYMRRVVAEIVTENMKRLSLSYPKVGAEEMARFEEMRRLLEGE